MPTISPPARVLVTGANGFIAAWIIKELLEEGFAVRGTVRSTKKSERCSQKFKEEVESGRLEFIEVPDITVEGAFDDTIRDMDAILHVASPVVFDVDDPEEIIKPAVRGTVSILQSARLYGASIKRIVITSSTAAIFNEDRPGYQDETFWNNSCIAEVREKGREARPMSKYCAAKTLAERAAWEFYEKHKTEVEWDLVTLCMPWTFGPILQDIPSPNRLNESMQLFYEEVFGSTLRGMGYPSEGNWVDVRDVARGHMQSLQVSEASGNRFILSKGPYTRQEWFDVVERLDEKKSRFRLRIPGGDKGYKFQVVCCNAKAKAILGLQFRDKIVTEQDIIEDFRTRGWIV